METKNVWTWEAVSSTWRITKSMTPPSPPSDEEIRLRFESDGKVAEAMGEFVQRMLDEGYEVTLLGYSTEITKQFIRSGHTGGYIDHYWKEYKTHTKLIVEFRSNPECFLTASPLVITAGAIYAIGKAIAIIIVAAGVWYALQNLTTTKKTYEKYGWVQNPDTGEWEWQVVEEITETKPPTEAWIGIVIIAIFLLIAIFGIGQFTGKK